MTSNKLPNINELSRQARRIYDAISQDELDNHSDEFIAIEIESEEHFFGGTKTEAVTSAKNKYSDKLIFVRPVGQIEKIQMHTKFSNSMYMHQRAF